MSFDDHRGVLWALREIGKIAANDPTIKAPKPCTPASPKQQLVSNLSDFLRRLK